MMTIYKAKCSAVNVALGPAQTCIQNMPSGSTRNQAVTAFESFSSALNPAFVQINNGELVFMSSMVYIFLDWTCCGSLNATVRNPLSLWIDNRQSQG